MMSDKACRYYDAIDGLRAIGAIGILMMHVKANSDYRITGYWYDNVVTSFTNFVFLFMLISAFSMSCGYFEKVKRGDIRLDDFYKKRFVKIWPYFAMLVFTDLIISPSKESLYESFADLTLCFGLLPNAKITVIGVGWFLGLIFLFYMLFPFFTFLIGNRKKAWVSFLVAAIFHFLCQIYFFDLSHVGADFNSRANMLYSAVYFFAGGLIYLYKERLEKCVEKYSRSFFIVLIVSVVVYFNTKISVMTMLPMFSLMLINSLSEKCKILKNPILAFIGHISMEIYLSHMVIFRILEKADLLHIIKIDTLAYFTTVLLVLTGTIVFSLCAKKMLMIASVYLKIIQRYLYGGEPNGQKET